MNYDSLNLLERTAQIAAHRACCNEEHDPSAGKLAGFCVVCGVPWPCEFAGEPPSTGEELPPDALKLGPVGKLLVEDLRMYAIPERQRVHTKAALESWRSERDLMNRLLESGSLDDLMSPVSQAHEAFRSADAFLAEWDKRYAEGEKA